MAGANQRAENVVASHRELRNLATRELQRDGVRDDAFRANDYRNVVATRGANENAIAFQRDLSEFRRHRNFYDEMRLLRPRDVLPE